MQQPSLLRQFEYSYSAIAETHTSRKPKLAAEISSPPMQLYIDFEKGILKLTGKWQFFMAANKHNEPAWFTYHPQRVIIEVNIEPAFSIDLTDPNTDGLMFPLNGTIREGEHFSLCSGLLVIDNVRLNEHPESSQCDISFYLYDLQFEGCEINFKLPVYVQGMEADHN